MLFAGEQFADVQDVPRPWLEDRLAEQGLELRDGRPADPDAPRLIATI